MIGIQKQYLRVHNYLSQVFTFSGKDGVPKITQAAVAIILSVSGSTVSRFMRKPSENKLAENFVKKFQKEVSRWPKSSNTIGRALQKTEVIVFLNLPQTVVKCSPTQPLVVRHQPKMNPLSKAPIVISYRGHAMIKDGQGMLYDHFTLQRSTEHPTVVSFSSKGVVRKSASSHFKSAIKLFPAKLLYGNAHIEGKVIPPEIQQSTESGLLVIPGRVRVAEYEPNRLVHEYKIIRDALNRGQPILGLCAGAWRVWEQNLIFFHHPDKLTLQPGQLTGFHQLNHSLVDVHDHNYGGGMLRLDKMGKKVVCNVQIHDITVEKTSLLHNAMRDKVPDRISVNSVHWKAVNDQQLPSNMSISARSKDNPHIQKLNRQSSIMKPQENAVEAFESRWGVPIMGIQWHPEGYNPNESNSSLHIDLLKYMAQAGDAYYAKRQMLKEFSKTLNLTS